MVPIGQLGLTVAGEPLLYITRALHRDLLLELILRFEWPDGLYFEGPVAVAWEIHLEQVQKELTAALRARLAAYFERQLPPDKTATSHLGGSPPAELRPVKGGWIIDHEFEYGDW